MKHEIVEKIIEDLTKFNQARYKLERIESQSIIMSNEKFTIYFVNKVYPLYERIDEIEKFTDGLTGVLKLIQ